MKRDLLKPTADVVFKRIFGQEKEITIEFINLFVDPPQPVVDITYLKQEMLADNREGKVSVVDIRCTDTNNQHFILEMQVVHHEGFLNRQLLYACKAYALQFNSGIHYSKTNPVYLLTILDYEILPGVAGWLHPFSFKHEHENIQLDGLSVRLIELGKRKKMDNFNLDHPLDRWMTFLAEPEKLITMQKFDISVYPNLMKAVEILDRSNFTIEQQIAYDNHLFAVADINQSNIDSFDRGHGEGFGEGIEKGRVEGEQKGLHRGLSLSRAIIRELKKGELSHEDIAIKFSIPIAEVKLMAEDLDD
jgi:predicted transposase/invertase (TIGR01784 family)